MPNVAGGSFKQIAASDIKTRKTSLNQLVDIIQEDISGSSTRKKYQVFITGGVGPGVTSSLYQTVYDQAFTLQTANPMFDMTVGLFQNSSTVSGSHGNNVDANGKYLYPSTSLMMREKVDLYRQHAAHLLGDADASFSAPYGNVLSANRIDEALFINYKRLFTRDGLKPNTYAVKLYRSASEASGSTNLFTTSQSGSTIFSDTYSNNYDFTGAKVGNILNSANANETEVGVIFYDKGTVVLDMAKIFSGSQKMSGTIPAMANATSKASAGFTVLGDEDATAGNTQAKLIPDFVVSSSIDTIIDHIASTRFSSGSLTATTFQNKTDINSTLIFCRASADEFNFSTNPTYVDAESKIVVIDEDETNIQRSFTFPTTIGLHDQFGNLLAVAKLSRPIEKNDEKDITFRVRLDF